MRNVLNGLDLDTYIYKYMPLRHLVTMIRDSRLYINKVSTWEDVYENFIYKEPFQLNDGRQISAGDIASNVYGQSWTSLEESDAMWRIYSVNPNDVNIEDIAVRIKTTARKLFDVVYYDDICMASTFIGKVNYMDTEQINDWLQAQTFQVNCLQRIFAESSMIKRPPFSHEQEIRIIVSKDSYNAMSPMLSYNIPDIQNFVEHLTLDPRLDGEKEETLRTQLGAFGVDNNIIHKSQLYTFTPLQTPIRIIN